MNTLHHDTYGAITPDQWNLNGRVVLVTGSSRGIGRASAIAYARAGASGIIVTGRSATLLDQVEKEVIAAAETRGKGSTVKVLKLVLDVTDESVVNEAARRVRGAFGRLDILVNNAGYLAPFSPINETKTKEWNQTWSTHITGIFLVIRAFAPLLISSENGLKIIVNVSSVAALQVAPNYVAYAVSIQVMYMLSGQY